jgi:muramoyltetrapeptide carboxypeptidase
MITPPYLQKGNRVGIVSPGRKVQQEDVEVAIKDFSAWGLIPVLATNLFSNKHGYLAGTDQQRLSDLQAMMDDDSIQAVICARGGYGTTRLLDKLELGNFIKTPKWVVGFSDITSLHLKLFKEGVVSIHGTMPVLFSKNDSKESIEALRKLLFGESIIIEGAASQHNKPGQAVGQIIGGNLSLIADSIGTSSEPDTGGKILVIEEIDEYLYKLDRMLVQLKRAGKLANLSGLVVGHFTDIKDIQLAFGETVEEIIRNHTSQFNFPIGFKFPIGHENPNLPFKHGARVTLTVTRDGSFLEDLSEPG